MAEIAQVRPVVARILTPVGWVKGTLSVPRIVGLLDWLDHVVPFVRVTSAKLPHRDGVLPVFDLRRGSMNLVLPEDASPLHAVAPRPEPTELHDATCLLAEGVVNGRLALVPGVDLHDFLVHHEGFIALQACTLHLLPQFDLGEDVGPRALVLVNAARMIGVAHGGGKAPQI